MNKVIVKLHDYPEPGEVRYYKGETMGLTKDIDKAHQYDADDKYLKEVFDMSRVGYRHEIVLVKSIKSPWIDIPHTFQKVLNWEDFDNKWSKV